jgi:hypothetical protein
LCFCYEHKVIQCFVSTGQLEHEKMTVFWVVTPCSLVLTDVSEALAASMEAGINNSPDGSYLHARRREILKCQVGLELI